MDKRSVNTSARVNKYFESIAIHSGRMHEEVMERVTAEFNSSSNEHVKRW